MSGVIVDSNVLLDLFTEDRRWFAWSSAAMEEIGEHHTLVINPIIYSEVSIRFSTIEELEETLSKSIIVREDLPYEAAFLAGKIFMSYRRRGGLKLAPLPDFFVGAHAAVLNYQILTRDETHYRTYFPNVRLVTPNQAAGMPRQKPR